jgi:hypothetical protein
MGLLRDLVATTPTGKPEDAGALRDLISAVVTADGSVDAAEHITVEALHETVPQLRAAPPATQPPALRKALLASLKKVTDPRLRRQLWVIAVDLALSSEGVSEREDLFLEELRAVLSIDDAFARQTIAVFAAKYARGV